MELDLPGIISRVSIMYVYALALMRISGKQSVSQLTALDFVVVTIIGDLFDDVFWADVPVWKGMVAMATLIVVHILVTYVSSRNNSIHQLLVSPATLAIQEGRLVQKTLQKERTPPEEVQFEMRLVGEEHFKEVQQGRWEPKGRLSIIKKEENKPVKKKDIDLFG